MQYNQIQSNRIFLYIFIFNLTYFKLVEHLSLGFTVISTPLH